LEKNELDRKLSKLIDDSNTEINEALSEPLVAAIKEHLLSSYGIGSNISIGLTPEEYLFPSSKEHTNFYNPETNEIAFSLAIIFFEGAISELSCLNLNLSNQQNENIPQLTKTQEYNPEILPTTPPYPTNEPTPPYIPTVIISDDENQTAPEATNRTFITVGNQRFKKYKRKYNAQIETHEDSSGRIYYDTADIIYFEKL
jgi:hypothetical protein